MDNIIKYHLFTKLSEELLYQHIYPFIYKFQSKDLLSEIQKFPQTKRELYRVYDLPIDRDTLYYDLLSYMNKRSVSVTLFTEEHENILRRHVMLKDYNASKILEFYTQYFSVNKLKDIDTKCGVLWGLFTESERITFICRRLSFLESHL